MNFILPFSGTVITLDEIPDYVFSQRLMGDGFAIDISDNVVIAPTDGIIKAIFPTGHAVAIEAENGFQYLIHLGLETHALKNVFKLLVKKGQVIRANEPLIEIKLKNFKRYSSSTLCPIVFLSGEKVSSLQTGYFSRGTENIVKFGRE